MPGWIQSRKMAMMSGLDGHDVRVDTEPQDGNDARVDIEPQDIVGGKHPRTAMESLRAFGKDIQSLISA